MARLKSTDVSEEHVTFKAACSSETSVEFQWTTWRYIHEDRTLHCEKFKHYSFTFTLEKQVSGPKFESWAS
jgi:hypothetical protein